MEFDGKAYWKAITLELKGRTVLLNDLQTAEDIAAAVDLEAMYAIEPGMSAPQLAERVKAVRNVWKVETNGRKATTAQALNRLDQVLENRVNLSDPQAWAQIENLRTSALAAEREGFVAFLKANAPLKVITDDGLAILVKASGTMLPPDAVRESTSAAGLRLVSPLEIPDLANREGIRGLITNLERSGARTIFGVVYPGFNEEFSVLGTPRAKSGKTIDLSAIRAAEAETQKRQGADNEARKKTLAALSTALTAGMSPEDVFLFQLALSINDIAGIHLAAVKRLQDVGVTEDDAQRIVLAVSEAAGSTSRNSVETVRQLIAERQLSQARSVLESLPVDADGLAAVRTQLAELGQRVARLEQQGREAQSRGDLAKAASAFQQILEIDAAQEGVADALAALPPLPPDKVLTTVAVNDTKDPAVVIQWINAPGLQDDTDFVVVRTIARPAALPSEGRQLDGVREDQVSDLAPPVAQDLFYTVFARRSGKYSVGAHCRCEVLPPPRGISVEPTRDGVNLRYSVDGSAATKVLLKVTGNGQTKDYPATLSGSCVTDLQLGVGYVAELTVEYRGGLKRSTPVSLDFVPRASATAVPHLDVRVDANGVATASWKCLEHQVVEVRYSQRSPVWSFGQEIPAAEATAFGDQLSQAGVPRAGAMAKGQGKVPNGILYFVPFTATGRGTMLVGQPIDVAAVPPVARLSLERRGEDTLLLWEWPHDVIAVDVEWEGAGGRGAKTFTPEVVRTQGGALIPTGAGEFAVSVYSVVGTGTDRKRSSSVKMHERGLPPAVTYRVNWPTRILGKFRGKMRVTLDSSIAVTLPLVIVAKPGSLPMSVDQGDVVFSGLVEVKPPLSAQIELSLPPGRGTLFVRCFSSESGDTFNLQDPPATELKSG
jgi:hypothetical protein